MAVVRAMLYGNETISLPDALDDTPELYDAGEDDVTDSALQAALEEDEGDFGLETLDEPGNDQIDTEIAVDSSLELPQFTYSISEVINQ